jgi:hypothetical protein
MEEITICPFATSPAFIHFELVVAQCELYKDASIFEGTHPTWTGHCFLDRPRERRSTAFKLQPCLNKMIGK